jgi:hypothetical protein
MLLFSLLLTIFSALQFKSGECKVHLSISNNLTNALQLGVHCHSKQDDIGFRSLHFRETYSFSFNPNVFTISGYTLFYCSFTWVNQSRVHYYDVYNERHDLKKCKDECHYEVNQSGPCLANHDSPRECFEWNK